MDRDTIPRLAVRRPVTCIVLLVACIVTGAIAYARMPIELLPGSLEAPFLFVRAAYPDASPEETLDRVTRPIEEALQGVSGLARIETSSGRVGAWAFLEFRSGTDMGAAYVRVRDLLDRVEAGLPDEVERIEVFRWNPNDTPIAYVVIGCPEADGGIAGRASTLVDDVIRPRVERIAGVASCEVRGVYEADVRVELDPHRLQERRLGLFPVAEDLQRASFRLGAGTIDHEGRRYLVRSDARIDDPADLLAVQVGSGDTVPLGDLGEATYGVHSISHIIRVDGLPQASITVFKTSQANAVRVCRDLHQVVLEELARNPRLAGFRFHFLWDQGAIIEESVDDVVESAVVGGALAVVVLFLFLRRVRMTLMIAAAIPLSLTITLVILFFQGASLNVLSMMGLMLAVGMLIDNSIVVVESIDRIRREGLDAETAAIRGTGEVGLAVLVSTATTIVVFVPLILMESRFRQFMAAIGGPLCWSLAASLAVALVVTPLAAKRLAGRVRGGAAGEASEAAAAPPASLLERAYGAALGFALDRRLAVAVVTALIVGSVAIPWEGVERTVTNEGGIRRIDVSFQFPPAYTLEAADRVMRQVEGAVIPRLAELGAEHAACRFDAESGNLVLYLGAPGSGGLETEEAIERLQAAIPRLPGVQTELGWRSQEQAGWAVEYRIRGDDPRVLAALAADARERLRTVAGVASVDLDDESQPTELAIEVERSLAERFHIPTEMAVFTVASALRGTTLPPLVLSGREVPVRLEIAPEALQTTRDLLLLPLPTPTGATVPLERIVEMATLPGPGSILRENGRTQVTVTGRTPEDDLSGIYERADRALASVALPPGYEMGRGASFEELETAEREEQFATIVGGVSVFLLMGMLFESILLPFSIILCVPLGMVGVYWTLWLTDTSFDIMCGIGVVLLIGIVVNNGIVLVDAIHQRRERGMPRRDAVIDAGRARLRPILMTALTTIVGLIPMAVGSSHVVNVPYQPLGRTVMGGLLVSTLLTLLLVPVAYTLMDDLGALIARLVRALVAPAAAPAGGPEAAPARAAD